MIYIPVVKKLSELSKIM